MSVKFLLAIASTAAVVVLGQHQGGTVDQYRCETNDDCFGRECNSFEFATQECLQTQQATWAVLECNASTQEVKYHEYSAEGCAPADRGDTVLYYLNECLIFGTGSLMFENCKE